MEVLLSLVAPSLNKTLEICFLTGFATAYKLRSVGTLEGGVGHLPKQKRRQKAVLAKLASFGTVRSLLHSAYLCMSFELYSMHACPELNSDSLKSFVRSACFMINASLCRCVNTIHCAGSDAGNVFRLLLPDLVSVQIESRFVTFANKSAPILAGFWGRQDAAERPGEAGKHLEPV